MPYWCHCCPDLQLPEDASGQERPRFARRGRPRREQRRAWFVFWLRLCWRRGTRIIIAPLVCCWRHPPLPALACLAAPAIEVCHSLGNTARMQGRAFLQNANPLRWLLCQAAGGCVHAGCGLRHTLSCVGSAGKPIQWYPGSYSAPQGPGPGGAKHEAAAGKANLGWRIQSVTVLTCV
jgi:hypothetical protein